MLNPAQRRGFWPANDGAKRYARNTNQSGPGRGVCTSGRDLSRLIGVDL